MVSLFYAGKLGFAATRNTHSLATLLEYEIVLDSHRLKPFGFSIVFLGPERGMNRPLRCSKLNSYFHRHTLLGTMETRTGMAVAASGFQRKRHAVTLSIVDPVF